LTVNISGFLPDRSVLEVHGFGEDADGVWAGVLVQSRSARMSGSWVGWPVVMPPGTMSWAT
jgi:hypothetical protein